MASAYQKTCCRQRVVYFSSSRMVSSRSRKSGNVEMLKCWNAEMMWHVTFIFITFLSRRNLWGCCRGPRGVSPEGGIAAVDVAVGAIGADLCDYGRRVHLILEDIELRVLILIFAGAIFLPVLTWVSTRFDSDSTQGPKNLTFRGGKRTNSRRFIDTFFVFRKNTTQLFEFEGGSSAILALVTVSNSRSATSGPRKSWDWCKLKSLWFRIGITTRKAWKSAFYRSLAKKILSASSHLAAAAKLFSNNVSRGSTIWVSQIRLENVTFYLFLREKSHIEDQLVTLWAITFARCCLAAWRTNAKGRILSHT